MNVVALSGGVGGAKLALGLDRVLDPGCLTVIVNTADDFDHLGLRVSPDLDSVLYALADLDNPETGWGRRDETWTFMDALAGLGGETWFRLGDGDLATHVERTRRLQGGEPLSAIMDDFRTRLGIASHILPMTDAPVRTVVETDGGELDFQHYFVRDRCEPRVTGFRFDGAAAADPTPGVIEALADPALAAIIICPSNPFVSVDPILAVPGIRDAVVAAAAPVVAVSPIVGGRALRGPAAKMMAELGVPVTAQAVARHYEGLLTGFVTEASADSEEYPIPALRTKTMMTDLADREQLARDVLAFAGRLVAG
jgi:LPPG:FO 2-phospho-L-lactate transferase